MDINKLVGLYDPCKFFLCVTNGRKINMVNMHWTSYLIDQHELNPLSVLSLHLPLCCYCCLVLSHVWLFETPWTVAARLLSPWEFPDKITGVGCCFFLHGIFLTQGLNPCLLHWQVDASPLNHQGNDSHSRLDIKTHTFCRLNQAHSCWRFRFHYVFWKKKISC